MANNKTTGLLLLGGATALFVLPKLLGASGETKGSQGGGGSSGGFIIPTGFGSSELTNPNSTSPNYPDINIYESNDFDKALPTSNAPAETKKSSSYSPLKTQYHTDSEGNLVGVTDSIFTPNPQSRLPTASDKLNYAISSGGSSSSSKKSSSSGSSSSGSSSSGSLTGTFQGLPVSVPNTSTKKESTPSKPSSFWGRVGGAIGSVIKRGIFI